MNSHKYLFLEKYSKVGSIVGIFTFAFLIIGLITDDAHANFATTESSTVAACPANHKMYYVGASPPSFSTPAPNATVPVESLLLDKWVDGETSRIFEFKNGKTLKISFPIFLEPYRDINQVTKTSPYYGSFNGVTSNALTIFHQSTGSKTNNTINLQVNNSVSKSGFVIQDLDSIGASPQTAYIEQADISASGGRLTYNSTYHTPNNLLNTTIVTAKTNLNCGSTSCPINASWGYKSANIPLSLNHNNIATQPSAQAHALGYSDFYFCLAPPKLIVKKALNGTRFGTDDEFEISTTEDATTSTSAILLSQFTTTGDGSTLGNSSSSVQN